jgi:RNA-splicing ligase RtcB
MSSERSRKKKPFDPADFPALREFFPAYLHEDFTAEYGSAAEAVRGFLAEASGDEILQAKEEWEQLHKAFHGVPLKEFQRALEQLGSAWLPQNEAEVQSVDEILSRAQA